MRAEREGLYRRNFRAAVGFVGRSQLSIGPQDQNAKNPTKITWWGFAYN